MYIDDILSMLLDFELYTRVEHNRPLIHTEASAIVSFIQGTETIIHKIESSFLFLLRLDQWFK
jgi:hypothetical protein